MSTQTVEELKSKKCVPCEGGVPKVSKPDAESLLKSLPGWTLTDDGQKIVCKWTVKNFLAGMDFLNKVAQLAEKEGHHPDVHLTGYKHVKIELSTHAIGGLSENDFILAAKIGEIPVETKK
jgi:4a-hydroxytetrahydrobiopterin dehydratase